MDGKQNPWKYDYYEEIKKAYSLVSKKDWIPLNSEYLYQVGEKYVELVMKLYKDGLFHHLNDGFIIYYLEKFTIDEILESKGLNLVSDESEIENTIREILNKYSDLVNQYKSGNERASKAIMGMIMKENHGSLSPQLAKEVMMKLLNE